MTFWHQAAPMHPAAAGRQSPYTVDATCDVTTSSNDLDATLRHADAAIASAKLLWNSEIPPPAQTRQRPPVTVTTPHWQNPQEAHVEKATASCSTQAGAASRCVAVDAQPSTQACATNTDAEPTISVHSCGTMTKDTSSEAVTPTTADCAMQCEAAVACVVQTQAIEERVVGTQTTETGSGWDSAMLQVGEKIKQLTSVMEEIQQKMMLRVCETTKRIDATVVSTTRLGKSVQLMQQQRLHKEHLNASLLAELHTAKNDLALSLAESAAAERQNISLKLDCVETVAAHEATIEGLKAEIVALQEQVSTSTKALNDATSKKEALEAKLERQVADTPSPPPAPPRAHSFATPPQQTGLRFSSTASRPPSHATDGAATTAKSVAPRRQSLSPQVAAMLLERCTKLLQSDDDEGDDTVDAPPSASPIDRTTDFNMYHRIPRQRSVTSDAAQHHRRY